MFRDGMADVSKFHDVRNTSNLVHIPAAMSSCATLLQPLEAAHINALRPVLSLSSKLAPICKKLYLVCMDQVKND